MVGFGVMGRNLLLSMTDHNFSMAGYGKEPSKVEDMCRVKVNSYQLKIPIACRVLL